MAAELTGHKVKISVCFYLIYCLSLSLVFTVFF